jgi:site-specific recombinase XerD
MSSKTAPTFAGLVQEFFTDYMVQQRALSPRTVASYRDTFVLLLGFGEKSRHLPANDMTIADLNARFLADFLDHLETDRHNSVGYLTRDQMLAVIDVPTDTWIGQRDRLLLTLMFNTGARVSEILGVRVVDIVLGPTNSIRLHGKGRKQRTLPLWKNSAQAVRDWLHLNPKLRDESPLMPGRDGHPMTRANVAQRLQLAVDAASALHPQLKTMSVSPHVVRHSTAMGLLQSGVELCEIALWLGHESPSTTHMYIEADLAMKERSLARLKQPEIKQVRYRPPKALLDFLQGL